VFLHLWHNPIITVNSSIDRSSRHSSVLTVSSRTFGYNLEKQNELVILCGCGCKNEEVAFFSLK